MAAQDNHVINRPASTILDIHVESDRSTRWIKEATYTFGTLEGWTTNYKPGLYLCLIIGRFDRREFFTPGAWLTADGRTGGRTDGKAAITLS